jgi:hypothetical protein
MTMETSSDTVSISLSPKVPLVRTPASAFNRLAVETSVKDDDAIELQPIVAKSTTAAPATDHFAVTIDSSTSGLRHRHTGDRDDKGGSVPSTVLKLYAYLKGKFGVVRRACLYHDMIEVVDDDNVLYYYMPHNHIFMDIIRYNLGERDDGLTMADTLSVINADIRRVDAWVIEDCVNAFWKEFNAHNLFL